MSTNPPSLYRIGTVSRLSGIPVPTLRVWQTRYQAFSPTAASGQHRLFNEDDLRKASLLKALTAMGHGIRLIAGLPTEQLQQLLLTGVGLDRVDATGLGGLNTVGQQALGANPRSAHNAATEQGWAVVGGDLADHLNSARFAAVSGARPLKIQQVWPDLAAANVPPVSPAPRVLAVSVTGLNDATAQQILKLTRHHAAGQTQVFYSYGQLSAVAQLTGAGCAVHRWPMNDQDLAHIVRQARPALSDLSASSDTLTNMSRLALPAPRQFSDAVLQRVANIPSQVLCECPRHVAELIGQLGQFEDYSRDCLNQNAKDAELHQQLHRMAATARALFEQALHMVATHEGISLQEEA